MAFLLNDWLELVCPRCRAALDECATPADPHAESVLRCSVCEHEYPVVLGIPDLRIFPDPYISILGDWTKGRMLHEQFAARDFPALAELYFHVTPEVPEADVRANMSRLVGGVARADAALDSWRRSFGAELRGRVLDVGCGTAPLLVAGARRGAEMVGVDVAFRWLVIGKKRLEDAGVRATLVAACAEALPFRDDVFDVVTMQSALEVLRDQRAALSETHRVLRSRGDLLVSTPNRLSIGPDPHIGTFGGSLLPWRLVSAIARLKMARPPLRRLLSMGGLRRALRAASFADVRTDIPSLSDSQRAQFRGVAGALAAGYEQARTMPVARSLLALVGPLLQARGTKS